MLTTTITNRLDLTGLSDEAFDDIVNQDVRGTLDPVTSSSLRESENVNRWHDMLLTLKRRVEAQLTANKGEQAAKQAEYLSVGSQGKQLWLHYRAQNEKWRQGAIRFKNGVEDKLAEAKRSRSLVRSESYVTMLVKERDKAMHQSFELRTAIASHRIATESELDDDDDGDDQYEIDTKLWNIASSI